LASPQSDSGVNFEQSEFQFRSEYVKWKPATFRVKHHSDLGFDHKFHDVADSDLASYAAHPIDEIEPLPDNPDPYRGAALDHLQVLLAIDEFMTVSENPRLAWITVAITFDLISIRGLTPVEIAKQLGTSAAEVRRATARFQEMANLDSAGSIQRNSDGLDYASFWRWGERGFCKA
jgi:hypothetical protein